jgi:hypothetical protein
MIVETSDNRFYSVRETGNPDLGHLWVGIEVRLTKGKWVKRPNRRGGGNRPQLIRKAASKVITEHVCETS